ncbi:hypothetical protein BJ165DRAFT_1029400 [Panaeolus papilionaceus]|nr:hypothetical protein BJ165DRAFT_1029400 [Panaeolus papilionaceus]
MRVSILFSLFMAFAAVGVNAKPTRTTAAMKRFGFKGDAAEENLTTAQRYARELTRRTPTRRSTAKKRQESPVPDISTPQTIYLGLTNQDTGSFVGFVDLGSDGLTVNSEGSGTTFIHLVNPSWTINTQQRVNIPGITYPALGLVQRPGDSTYLGPGLPSAVFIAGVTSSTIPGSLPVLLPNSITGVADLAVETDVWTVNFNDGSMRPVWINPDGTAATLTIISNGNDIVATGDFTAFNIVNGGNWFTISLAFSVTSI